MPQKSRDFVRASIMWHFLCSARSMSMAPGLIRFTGFSRAKPREFGAIKWNFTKFLIDRKGGVAARFAPAAAPKGLEKEIEKLL